MRSLSVLKSQQLKKLLGLPATPPKPWVESTKGAVIEPLFSRKLGPASTPAAETCPLRRLGLAGSWVLPPGRAVTLQSADDSALQVTQGRIWATLDGPHSGPANDLGDVVLQAGDRLALRAGQRVVIEAFLPGVARRAAVEGACFSLDLGGD